jgi:hypothetical protein
MNALERTRLLIIDDWGPEPLNAEQRRDLLEIIDDRYDRGSLLRPWRSSFIRVESGIVIIADQPYDRDCSIRWVARPILMSHRSGDADSPSRTVDYRAPRGLDPRKSGFAPDSLLEESRFGPLVPR